jgi:hypothetical protein
VAQRLPEPAQPAAEHHPRQEQQQQPEVEQPRPVVAGLQGWYVYGDLCSGTIWGYDPTSTSVPRVVVLANLPQLAAVATGPDRELYAVSNAGTVARFIPA